MIISKTPIRISFLGGGTDYPEYFERHPGAVIGTAINRYAYINVKETHPFFDYKYRISYRKAEIVDTIDEIQHPSVKACLKFMDLKEHLEIHYQGDWPARTGLGSSSTFTVGLLNALHSFKKNQVNKKQLAKQAIYVEREIIKERVGWRDQIWASYGGMAKIEFFRDDFNYIPLNISKERRREFRKYLILFYTGIRRFAHDVLEEQIRKTKTKSKDADLNRMYDLVQEGEKYLLKSNFPEFGKLMHENWLIKKSLSHKISNEAIDEAYELARRHGAKGGKIVGAGGGGFLLLFADPVNHNKIRNSIQNMTEVTFDFDNTGSTIILNGTDHNE